MNAVSHRDLAVWKAAVALASKVYGATRDLPSEERSELSQQLRRAAAAVPTRIAEGAAHCSRIELMQGLKVARSSLAELETHVLIAARQNLLHEHEAVLQQIDELSQLLSVSLRKLIERRVPDAHFRQVIDGLTTVRPPRAP